MTHSIDSLNNKTVLITGGARGIGKGLAKACLEEGARVIITNLDSDTARTTCAELSSLGDIRAVRCDATDRGAVDALMDDIWSNEGPVDLVFCNAGAGGMEKLLETSIESVRHQFATNFESALHIAQSYVPRMSAGDRPGHIMFTGSENSLVFPEGNAPLAMGIYGCTKHSMLILAEWLRYELRKSPVSVSLLLPGPVLTERLAETFAALENDPSNPDLRSVMPAEAEQVLRDRFITPETCAAIAIRGLKLGLFFIPTQKHIRDDVDKRYREVSDAFDQLEAHLG